MLHNVIVGVRGRVTSGAYREGDYKVNFFRIVKTIFFNWTKTIISTWIQLILSLNQNNFVIINRSLGTKNDFKKWLYLIYSRRKFFFQKPMLKKKTVGLHSSGYGKSILILIDYHWRSWGLDWLVWNRQHFYSRRGHNSVSFWYCK